MLSALPMCSQCAPWVYGSLPPVCGGQPEVVEEIKGIEELYAEDTHPGLVDTPGWYRLE